jgi:hypothetical protein
MRLARCNFSWGGKRLTLTLRPREGQRSSDQEGERGNGAPTGKGIHCESLFWPKLPKSLVGIS